MQHGCRECYASRRVPQGAQRADVAAGEVAAAAARLRSRVAPRRQAPAGPCRTLRLYWPPSFRVPRVCS